jgi:hypothetical protein
MHKKAFVRGNNKNLKINFIGAGMFCKSLIFIGLNFAFDLGNLLKPASRLGKTLSSPSYAQSYPQVLWIA